MRLICLVACLLAIAPVAPALAQTIREAPPDKTDAAAAHFRLGVRFYRAGDYQAARVEFEAAHGLSAAPDLLHNLSLTTERLDRIGEAIDYEQRWLKAVGSTLTAEEADQVRGRLVRLRDLERQSSARPRSGREPGWHPPPGSIGLLAAGGGVLVAGLACGAAALVMSAELSSGQAYTLREIDALTARGRSLNGAAITLGLVGGVALAGGTSWAILHRLRRRRD